VDREIFRGQAQYNDHGVGVKFHAELGNLDGCGAPVAPAAEEFLAEELEARQNQDDFAFSIGTYYPQPRNLGDPGCIVILVDDGGEPGVGEDALLVALFGGVFDGYINIGLITGGNIQARFLDD
jgi:hypothetical protein